MTTGDTTATLVRAEVAAMWSDQSKVESKWDDTINSAVLTANQTVDGALRARNYTAAQIATWDLSREVKTEWGALLVVEKIMISRPGPEKIIFDQMMERLQEWTRRDGEGNIPLTAAGEPIDAASHDDNWDPESVRGPQDSDPRQFHPVQENIPGFGRNRSLRSTSTTDSILRRDC